MATARENPPHLSNHVDFNLAKEGRKYGLILAVATAVYLTVVNLVFDPLPLGVRFAKYLLIIPVTWIAVKSYFEAAKPGEAFKGEASLLFSIGAWSVGALVVLNLIVSSISPALSFEQFLNEGDTFADVMMNSFFVAMETLVMVMIIGFIFMQFYKGKGSPED